MIEETIRNYAIGEKIRALRKQKKMGLVELGRHSGLSAALLSKIETGKLVPPLPTLLRIAMVFSVGLDHFFSDEHGNLVSMGRTGPEVLGELFTGGDAKLKAAIHALDGKGKELTDITSGTGLLYVLQGEARAVVGENSWNVEEGDCVTFSLHLSHAFWGLGGGARVLFLVIP